MHCVLVSLCTHHIIRWTLERPSIPSGQRVKREEGFTVPEVCLVHAPASPKPSWVCECWTGQALQRLPWHLFHCHQCSICHHKIKHKKNPLFAIMRLSGSWNAPENATWVTDSSGTGAMAQWVRHWLCKHQEQSLDPTHQGRNQVRRRASVTSELWRWRKDPRAHWPVSIAKILGSGRDSCLKR